MLVAVGGCWWLLVGLLVVLAAFNDLLAWTNVGTVQVFPGPAGVVVRKSPLQRWSAQASGSSSP